MSAQQQKHDAIAKVQGKAQNDAVELFHDQHRRAYASVPVGGHRENWAVKSRDFRLWVTNAFFDILGAAPPKEWVTDAIHKFETIAICRSPRLEVWVRVAPHDGDIYIDLADDDWRAVKVSRDDGFCCVSNPPVKFRRTTGMAPLPSPAAGNLRDVVRFLNVSPKDEVLVLAWVVHAMRSGVPYPVLALSGVQGAGKSTTSKVLRSLIDPSLAMLTTVPRSERDLAIAATNSHLIVMDNLSGISAELSDMMCRLATGGGFRTRELYTNDSEMIFTYRRPLIINGIEELPMRADLLDRALLIHAEPIAEERRQDEATFWGEFEKVRHELLGGLLGVLAAGLARIESVELPNPPRMADFARLGVAIEEALGFAPGTFMAAYRNNLENAHHAALEASPVAKAIVDFLSQGLLAPRFHETTFCGTALRLLQELTCFVELNEDSYKEQAMVRKHPRWPKSANQLSAEIARVEPNLRKAGVRVERGRDHTGRFIRLELSVTTATAHDDGHRHGNQPENKTVAVA